MVAQRLLPTEEAAQVVALAREVASTELAPRGALTEAEHFPREILSRLGDWGCWRRHPGAGAAEDSHTRYICRRWRSSAGPGRALASE
jgi:hypothetical protein